MDDLRFRSQRSPRDDTPATMSLVTPPRNGSRMPQQQQQQQPQQHHHQTHQPISSTADTRSNLPRRFTTDSGRVPTLSSMPLTSPQRGPDPSQDYNNVSAHPAPLSCPSWSGRGARTPPSSWLPQLVSAARHGVSRSSPSSTSRAPGGFAAPVHIFCETWRLTLDVAGVSQGAPGMCLTDPPRVLPINVILARAASFLKFFSRCRPGPHQPCVRHAERGTAEGGTELAWTLLDEK